MKISAKIRITTGYIINLVVIIAIGIIYLNQIASLTENVAWHWVLFGLIILSIGMLTTVFFMLKHQLKIKKQYELDLIKSKKLLQSIIDNTSNPISVKKLNGEYLLVNNQYQKLFQSKAEDLIGKTNHDFLPKAVADRYRNSDMEVIKEEKEIHIEETMEQQDGEHIYLSVKFPLFDNTNRIYAIGSISTDITERKKTEQSLKAANTFFDLSIDSLVIADKTSFVRVNPSLSNILGYTTSELLAKPFSSFILSEDLTRTFEEIKTLDEGKDIINFKNRWICKDGSTKWLTWNATLDKSTGLIYAVVRDITEELELKQEAEEERNELLESQQKLNMILENISDGVIVANSDKQVLMANYSANELFKIEDDYSISFDFSDHFEVFYPDGKTTFPSQELPAQRALTGEITNDVDVILKNLETKEKRRVLLSGRPIVNSQNIVVAVVVTIKDISVYKKLEEDLERKDMESRTVIGYKRSQTKKGKTKTSKSAE
ncbi:PAS domain-containing protein [Gaetbulibacter aestuarii]|uniref:PAS domain S-box protein n=1 Tax=Gaetbulibacter aestuarii TaxID=1502358 RepID=A0ABW7MZ13_9FLAO